MITIRSCRLSGIIFELSGIFWLSAIAAFVPTTKGWRNEAIHCLR